ncbi:hypothetical protein FisN_15Hh146 [Fistulifera solaris]|uniref:RanBP2-type domain-containing protein n=1 Tax=Fistulifera solaris TaxID=1519565 RepID=A0A1Z5K9L2_FISSO|nr:hypothetical protein FisN_15Hh146 [Fistulifera solaris]|eukprot:GAX22959.1 hypothetical protein FisN_15Hh146 [Fistulifera solaris]
MTQKYDDVENKGKNDEPEIFATAVPAAHNEPPIPAGHARFYCSKCHTPYDLPDKATSWRCANCMTFNSITRGECEWCTII